MVKVNGGAGTLDLVATSVAPNRQTSERERKRESKIATQTLESAVADTSLLIPSTASYGCRITTGKSHERDRKGNCIEYDHYLK